MIFRFTVVLVLFVLLSCKFQKSDQVNEAEIAPEWAKKVVWYQVFPERFRNGDTLNDPTFADIQGAWPHNTPCSQNIPAGPPWQVHPWNSDWYELQPYEKLNGNDIWYNITRRRYGGDLQGIIDELDYLQQLGIGAIYLNPIFVSPSHHKYDQACYHHVDPTFGPDPEGDKALMASENPIEPDSWQWTQADLLALKLVEEVHKRGMRIIFDGVFNHMGINSFAFRDVCKNQQNSIYKDWFTIKSWDDSVLHTRFDYEGWFGIKDLPELKEDENGIVAGPKKYIFDITKRWMQPVVEGTPRDGIDGWRLDVAFCIHHKFWKDWRLWVKELNPDAYLTAEVIDSVNVVSTYLEGDEFDGVMNYNFAFICTDYFLNSKDAISTTEFSNRLDILRNAFPADVSYVVQNLFDSHDANRISSHIVNTGLGSFSDWGFYFGASKATNTAYKTRKPNKKEYDLLKLMVVFQMTYPGAPMIYYGDEIGMWGANDPCCRKPMVWPDINYQPEKFNPDQTIKPQVDSVRPNVDLLNHYKKMIALRNSHKALQTGNYKALIINDEQQLFAFKRQAGSDEIVVIINNSLADQKLAFPYQTKAVFNDALNGGDYKLQKNREIIIPAKWARVLVKIN